MPERPVTRRRADTLGWYPSRRLDALARIVGYVGVIVEGSAHLRDRQTQVPAQVAQRRHAALPMTAMARHLLGSILPIRNVSGKRLGTR